MRALTRFRFDEVLASQRPIDSLAGLNELQQVHTKFSTAQRMRVALGHFGHWSLGYHFNEATGNAAPAFGSTPLTAVGTPVYRQPGLRSGSDYAIGVDENGDYFEGGTSTLDVSGTSDLNIGWIGYLSGIPTTTEFMFVKGFAGTPARWGMYTSNTGITHLFVISTSGTVDVSLSALIGEWYAGIAYADRGAGKLQVAVKGLKTGTTVLSGQGNLFAGETLSNADAFRLANRANEPALKQLFDAAYFGASPGSAAGFAANISPILSNFAAYATSIIPVVDAAAGRGRSFVAMSGHGFEASDQVSGTTLLTRDASVQALVQWDFTEQSKLVTWALNSEQGGSWTSYARSNETLDGDFYLEMTIPATGTFAMLGFRRNSDATEGLGGQNRYFYINQNVANQLSVWESNSATFNGGSGSYAAGDLLRVERVSNVFKYWRKPVGGDWTLVFTGVTDSNTMVVSATTLNANAGYSEIRLYTGLYGAGTRKALSWRHLVELAATPTEHHGALYHRGKTGSASEYIGAGVELNVVNASAAIGEIAWLWQDTAGTLKRQVGGQFQVPTSGVVMLTATRRWASSSKVILRYYVGARLLAEIESVDGSIGGGTPGTTTIGARFDGSVYTDFFGGVIDELRVCDYEITPEEIEMTWERISKLQPKGYRAIRDLFQPDAPISDNPSSRIQKLLNLAGQAIGYAAAQVENFRRNLLPDRAYGSTLEQWEGIAQRPRKPSDSTDSRRARLLAHLRQRAGVSIPGLKAALKELIATSPDSLEFLAYPQEFKPASEIDFDYYKNRWSFSLFRPADANNWNTVSGAGLIKSSTLRKIAGSAAWDAGASSVETQSGDCVCEVTVGPIAALWAFGLSDVDVDVNFTSIDFALQVDASYNLKVYENGSLKSSTTCVVGDRIQVKRTGTAITYHMNDGAAFYTSLSTSSGAIRADVSINTVPAEVPRLVMRTGGFAGAANDLTWQSVTNVDIMQNMLSVLAIGGNDLTIDGSKKLWYTAALAFPASDGFKIAGQVWEGLGAHILTRVDPIRLPDRAEVGIAFHNDIENKTLFFGLRNDASTYKLITEVIKDGASLGVTVRATSLALKSYWLHLYHNLGPPGAGAALGSPTTWEMVAAYSSTNAESGYTPFTFNVASRFHWAVMYVRSFGGTLTNTVDCDFDDTRVYTPYGDRSLHFFVYRNGALSGVADVDGANSVINGLKHANTRAALITKKPHTYGDVACVVGRQPAGGN